MHERPSAAELVQAVRELLEDPLLAAADDAGRFELLVAAGALRIVERELSLAPGQEAEHAELLAGLGVADEAELAAGIRAGRFDGRAREVAAAVRRSVELRLAVDHPGYAAGAS